MHDSEPELVHFHEVGGLDAIADVCGVALALEELGIDRVECSPHPVLARVRRGRARPPAAARARRRSSCCAARRSCRSSIGAELVTPTGAALVRGDRRALRRAPAR